MQGTKRVQNRNKRKFSLEKNCGGEKLCLRGDGDDDDENDVDKDDDDHYGEKVQGWIRRPRRPPTDQLTITISGKTDT